VSYITCRALSRASLTDYVGLFQRCFPGDTKFSAQYLEWQYSANPHGKVIGVDAFHEGELVAHYAVIPRVYLSGSGERILGALSVNTATDPRHQGKGLFVRLAEETYGFAFEEGVKFVTGAANANSIPGFVRRLGFSELGRIRLGVSATGNSPPGAALRLDVDLAWLAWRFSNPGRVYYVRDSFRGGCGIFTYVRGVPFALGCVDTSASALRQVAGHLRGFAWPLSFVPGFFGGAALSVINVPLRLQPSPWHVIFRGADSDGARLCKELWFDGLAMDTF
jgi:GNAT superfamily N-acetyltransferase